MSISQLFILSRRGDSIIYRDFRRDIKKSNDIFFHNVNFIKEACLFNKNGSIISSGIDGCIKMKSYLKNSPEMKIVLSDDIVIGKSSYGGGRMELAGYTFVKV